MATEFVVKFKRQDAIAIFYLVDDEVTERKAMELLARITDKPISEQIGIVKEFLTEYSQLFAVVCAGGLMRFLGRKIEQNETGLVRLVGEEIGKYPKRKQGKDLRQGVKSEHLERGNSGGKT